MLGQTRYGLVSLALAALVVASACSVLDPRDIVMSHYPLERLTVTLPNYKSNALSDEEKRLLRGFIARAELSASLEKSATDVVGNRLRDLLASQKTWEEGARGERAESATSEVAVTWTITKQPRGHNPTKEMWPSWLVERYEITASLNNGSKAPVKSVSGTFIADDETGNPVARIELDLAVPGDLGAIAAGGSYSWTFPIEVDNYAPCVTPDEGDEPEWLEKSVEVGDTVRELQGSRSKLVALRAEISSLEEQVAEDESGDESSGGGCAFLDSAERRRAKLEESRAGLGKATDAVETSGQELQKLTGQDGPGEIRNGLNGGSYYIPPSPLEVCPRTDVEQAIPPDFIGSLQLAWIQGEVTTGTVRATPPDTPDAEEPAPEPAPSDDAATEGEPASDNAAAEGEPTGDEAAAEGEPTGETAAEGESAGEDAPPPDGEAATEEEPAGEAAAEEEPSGEPEPAASTD